ncbi:MAG: hypothetical protein CL868_09090 [Cytophagaceae bacterium]|nr:hypothetical protein [Cytophagaceae bacterium]|tara:strand:+ start:2707 stop:3297 length:591 start_codon:yes stop_codon:yes gene_type:complete
MKNVLAAFTVLFVAAAGFAQSKIGTVNSELIVASMPAMDTVQSSLQSYGEGLDKQYAELVTEYRKEVANFQKLDSIATTPEKTLEEKGNAIRTIQGRIQQFQQNSQQMVGLKRNELMQPLYTKVGEAIDGIAKAQGYSQIFTMSDSGLAYSDPKNDITQAVADKLKITLLTEEDIRKMQEERQKLMQQQQQQMNQQ